jgi:hypothetical protein
VKHRVTFDVGTTKVMIMCGRCGKGFKTRHRCPVDGVRWRVNTWGVVGRGHALMVLPVVRVATP